MEITTTTTWFGGHDAATALQVRVLVPAFTAPLRGGVRLSPIGGSACRPLGSTALD